MARLLVVDDNENLRRVLSMSLGTDHDVATAATAKTALHHLHYNPVDLVLLDWSMPVIDGMQLLREIRHDAKLHPIPVIMLTGRIGPTAKAACLRAGADAFVAKPCDPDMLESLVNETLRRSAWDRASRREQRMALLT